MYIEGLGQLQNIIQTHVSLTTLDTAHIGRVQTGTFRQGLLRHAFRETNLAEPFPEATPIFIGHHASDLWRPTMSPETMSIVGHRA